jgi:fumarate reductase flavoprotein subunit
MEFEGKFDFSVPVVVVGAGGCGLTAALAAAAASNAGAEVLVIERDRTPLGSTAMSTGLIPAAGMPDQAERGIDDSPDLFLADIVAKTKGRVDLAQARKLVDESADTVQWLRGEHAVPLSLVEGFLYPGHSRMRMFGTQGRSGFELMVALQAAAAAAGVTILTEATVESLFVGSNRSITGVAIRRPAGEIERVGCDALILACCGFGGNAAMVRRWIPEMADAVYHGHPGNTGDAVRWGGALGAATEDMSSYQGHGGLAVGHGIPILWPLIMEGGFQVNTEGRRFSNEAAGYSEQAAQVNAQPGRIAWSIFDERLHKLMLGFEDYRDAVQAGAIVDADTIPDLAAKIHLPAPQLSDTIAEIEQLRTSGAADRWGRVFSGKPPLTTKFHAAKVTGALFHTQGGLRVDGDARVLRQDGAPFPNLFAGGGAARGISGPDGAGYIAGNGLLTATTLGKLAGRAAARQVGSA